MVMLIMKMRILPTFPVAVLVLAFNTSKITFHILHHSEHQNTVLESPLEWDAEYYKLTDLLGKLPGERD